MVPLLLSVVVVIIKNINQVNETRVIQGHQAKHIAFLITMIRTKGLFEAMTISCIFTRKLSIIF